MDNVRYQGKNYKTKNLENKKLEIIPTFATA
jgi:hypothetical protein